MHDYNNYTAIATVGNKVLLKLSFSQLFYHEYIMCHVIVTHACIRAEPRGNFQNATNQKGASRPSKPADKEE